MKLGREHYGRVENDIKGAHRILFFSPQRQDEMHRLALEQTHQPISKNQAALNAMIEKARSSTWQENLETAAAAHDHFMFGNTATQQRRRITVRTEAPARLMKRLTVQADEMLKMRSTEPQF